MVCDKRPRRCRAAVGLILIALVSGGPMVRGAEPPPTAEELLGFSRYLPEETTGYLSLVSMGRLHDTIAASQAWQQVAAAPEIAEALKQMQATLASNDVPPEARMALDLLAAVGKSEVTLATSPEVSRDLLALARAGLLSVAVFAPSRFPPDSPPGLALEAKQAPLRAQWLATLPTVRIPSFVVAARVREAAKFEPFVRAALDQGRQALLADLNRGAPPEVRAAIEGAFSEVTLGKATMLRFHLRLGDVVPQQVIGQSLMRGLPVGENEQIVIVGAVSNLTLDVHLGFVGEYLTLAVSSDDKFIRQIAERHEGKSQATLAASAAFAPIRAELTPEALGIMYADASESQREIRQSLLRSSTR
jgi:hypothetical protein